MRNRALKSLLMTGLATILLATGGCFKPTVPDGVLDFELTDLYGNPVSLSEERFAGKAVLVEVWGMWCPPCLDQMPYLKHWHDAYRARGFEIIALEFAAFDPQETDDYATNLRAYLEEREIPYTVVQAGTTSDVAKILPELKNFRGFPTSIFVGRDGIVKHVSYGFTESQRGYYEKTIESLLNEPLGTH